MSGLIIDNSGIVIEDDPDELAFQERALKSIGLDEEEKEEDDEVIS